MAIQHRRGAYERFDPKKLMPGEWAVVVSGDPSVDDGRACYICFAAGDVKRMFTYEDATVQVKALVDGMKAAFEAEVLAATDAANAAASSANSAASSAKTATTKANTAAGKADAATSKADAATLSANSAATSATQAAGTASTAAAKADAATKAAVDAAGNANDAADRAESARTAWSVADGMLQVTYTKE